MEEITTVDSNLEAKKNKFPIGMKILCFYFGYTIFGGALVLQQNDTLLGPFAFGESLHKIYTWFFILLACVFLFGTITRKSIARKLILIGTAYGIGFALVHFTLSMLYLSELPNIYVESYRIPKMNEAAISSLVYSGVAYSIVTNSIIFWYVYSRKLFFIK